MSTEPRSATTLELINDSPPYRFISLGRFNRSDYKFEESNDFPIGSEYVLTKGKFPFTDYKDKNGKLIILTDVLNNKINAKITGRTGSCEEPINKYSRCNIFVERVTTFGDYMRKIPSMIFPVKPVKPVDPDTLKTRAPLGGKKRTKKNKKYNNKTSNKKRYIKK